MSASLQYLFTGNIFYQHMFIWTSHISSAQGHSWLEALLRLGWAWVPSSQGQLPHCNLTPVHLGTDENPVTARDLISLPWKAFSI